MKKLLFASLVIVSVAFFAFTKSNDNKKVYVYISHEVKDYATWKKGFDGDEVNRQKAGFKMVSLYRTLANPNIIVGIMEAPNAEAAGQFLNNPELKAAMEKAGVISAPEIKILNKVE